MDVSASATSATVTGLEEAKAYDFRVRATNAGGNGRWSDIKAVAGRPGPITSFSATESTTAVAVELSWSTLPDGGKGLTGYRGRVAAGRFRKRLEREPRHGPHGRLPAMMCGSPSLRATASSPALPTTFASAPTTPDRSSFYSSTDDATTIDQATASVADAAADEGDAVSFTVTLSHTRTSNVTLSWATSNGTATAPADYTAQSSGTVTIPAGQTTATFTVQTVEDASDENDETFTVTLSNPPAGVVLGRRHRHRHHPRRRPAAGAVGELAPRGGGRQRHDADDLHLHPVPGQRQDVTVDGIVFDLGNTATLFEDYPSNFVPTLTFAPGETSKTWVVAVNGDTDVEPDETVRVSVNLGASSPATFGAGIDTTTLPNTNFVEGTIVNDDEPPSEHAEISATDPSPLTEANLDGATLTVDLLGRAL